MRRGGDRALLELSEKFDGVRPDPLRIPKQRMEQAWQECPSPCSGLWSLPINELRLSINASGRKTCGWSGPHGEDLGRRWRPVHCAGLYVPGGRAAYPSTVLMNVVPAKVAGVDRLVMVTPPGPEGEPSASVLAAAHLAGVGEVYRVGGAQAIAALAWGTESIPRVDVISGPGNLYVTLAKKAVYGRVGIDSLAGPSEVLVIADATARVDQVAVDLMAQAEHDPLAAAILITTSESLAEALPAAIEDQLVNHPRGEIVRTALNAWGLIVVCDNLQTAARLSDGFAPEHLELLVDRTRSPWQRKSRMQGRSFWAPGPPRPSGTTWRAPTTPCPPPERPASRELWGWRLSCVTPA